jgi:ADP-heptose:LPS heptosyltransferase
VIAVHPGAGSPAKRWPAQCWAELLREATQGAQAAIVCGPADLEAASELGARIAAPLLRELPLLELSAALACARALLGHDSGVSHLAAALGVPTLALFGPTDPCQWAPRGPHAAWVRAPRGDLRRLEPACALAALRSRLAQASSR